MDAGKVAEVLENRAQVAHNLCANGRTVVLENCHRAECKASRAIVAELRAEAAAKTAPFVAIGIAEQTRLHLRALADVGLVPSPGIGAAPGCAAEATRPSRRYCEAPSDLTGRSA